MALVTNLVNNDLGTIFDAKGILRYDTQDNYYRLVVEIEKDLASYYRSLIPKWYCPMTPRWPPHITVVRPEKETPLNLEHWGKYDGQTINYKYGNIICHDKIYFWLRIFCTHLEEIRLELGLPVESVYTRPPDGFKKIFHTTIANCKY